MAWKTWQKGLFGGLYSLVLAGSIALADYNYKADQTDSKPKTQYSSQQGILPHQMKIGEDDISYSELMILRAKKVGADTTFYEYRSINGKLVEITSLCEHGEYKVFSLNNEEHSITKEDKPLVKRCEEDFNKYLKHIKPNQMEKY